jgi:predicted transcriptional regulator
MTIELSATVERELRDLAMMQRRDVGEIVEEAVRKYLEASAITDLEPGQIAEAQAKLMGELRGISEWKDGRD